MIKTFFYISTSEMFSTLTQDKLDAYLINEWYKNNSFPLLLFPIQISFEDDRVIINDR